MAKSAQVTSMATVSCVGWGEETLWKASIEGLSGIQSGWGKVTEQIDHQVEDFLAQTKPFQKWKAAHQKKALSSRALRWSLASLFKVQQDRGEEAFRPTDGLILGTTTGQIATWEASAMAYLNQRESRDPRCVYRPLSTLMATVRGILNHTGPCLTLSSACSASTQALALAMYWIQKKKVERCFVGGVEELCQLTRTGFQSLRLLSEEVGRPFEQNRKGINLSEGAAFLLLEDSSLSSLSPPSYGQLVGAGFSSDAYSMTAPHPMGEGCAQALKQALQEAHLHPHQIDWVHAHGTGSQQNDMAESRAIAKVFGEKVKVSSTKPIHGHPLGASGAMESIICLQALRHQTLPPNWGLKNVDPLVEVNPLRQPLKTQVQTVAKNTLGFGGVNTSLVFRRGEMEL